MKKLARIFSRFARRRAANGRRGSTLIEGLIAVAILGFITFGVLEMFSLSMLVNKGSEARTIMTFKCQQVVENIRLAYYFANAAPSKPDYLNYLNCGDFSSSASCATPVGLPFPIGTTLTRASPAISCPLPYDGTEGAFPAWGSDGANVFEVANGPFKMTVTITPNALPGTPAMWDVTVTCLPTDVATAKQFFGAGIKPKRVDYVAQIISK